VCARPGLLEQEQWAAALVARDFQRSVEAMQARARAAGPAGDGGALAPLSAANGHGAAAAAADAGHQNGMQSADMPPCITCLCAPLLALL
jgi:hypothetical protein